MFGILWTIAVLFFLFWVVGFVFVHVGGALIHLLLVVAIAAIVINLLTGGRRTTV